MAFSELLATSAFSFLRGAAVPEELVCRARELGLNSLALCDRDGLYGCVRAWLEARKSSLRFHVGAELSLSSGHEPVVRTEGPQHKAKAEPTLTEPPTLTLLVKSTAGYANLCRLLTRAHAGLPKGTSLLEPEMLREHNEGLHPIIPVQLGTSGKELNHWFPQLREVFGKQGHIGVFRRWDGYDRQRLHTARSWSLSTGFGILASARPLAHRPERKPLLDILQCIRQGTTLDRAGRSLLANNEAHLRSEEEMLRCYRVHPEWVHATAEVADSLQFELNQIRYVFPCELGEGQTADQRLAELVWQGAGARYPNGVPHNVEQQLQKELALISRLNVATYFICTWEVVQIAKRLKILCQGRGSAANSAVCYVLGITAVDPSRSNLLFERFLSEERNEPPDIDIDFEHERREEVIQEIYRRYGREHAAMVSEVICYRGKSALREVGKVFGFSLDQVDRLSGSITHWDTAELCEARLKEYGFDSSDQRLRQAVRWARQLEGFPRHLSIHVGGFVLSKQPLHHVAPVEPASMPGRTVIPWDKDDIDALGFFKMDILGLGMLTMIRKALALLFADGILREARDEEFDPLDVMTRVPSEDPAVYARISEADTVGVFQIESRAQMAMLPRLRPQKFYDLVIEVALVRPGPIQGGMVHPYLKRRNGEQEPLVPHPKLQPILARTLGVPLFQEQVMQIAIVGAGYSAGEADQLRRDMAAWKKSGKLLRHRERLLTGFASNDIPEVFGKALFEQIKGFGEYGFPESHAASFALLVYLSAWQKVHHPAHFCCAILNSQPMGFYSPASLVRDAQRHGVEVLPVDVCASNWDCTLEELSHGVNGAASKAVRLGLRQVKGLSQRTAKALERARDRKPFADLQDLRQRVLCAEDQLRALGKAGALSSLVPGRRQALWALGKPAQSGLFAGIFEPEPEVNLPALPAAEQLLLDYSTLGLSLQDHPMNHLRGRLRGVLRAEALQHVAHEQRVTVAGLVQSRQRPATASGVVFVTLEDETGIINVVLFSALYERYRHVARHSTLLLVRGRLERQLTLPRPGEVGRATAVIHVIAEHLERLDGRGTLRVPSRDFH